MSDKLVEVVDLELKKLRQRLLEKPLCLLLSEDAKKYLIKRGSNMDYGARPLRRAIEAYLEDPLSENILNDMFVDCDVVDVQMETIETNDAETSGPLDEQSELDSQRVKFIGRKLADMTPEELLDPQIVDFQKKLAEKNAKKEEEERNESNASKPEEKDRKPEPSVA